MGKINMVAAVAEDWGIGYNNKLLFHIREDMKHFKELTDGKVVIMGRKTYESIGKPLANRLNIVLTKQKIPGCLCINTIDNLLDAAKRIQEDVYVIGGESLYKIFMPYTKTIFLSKIYKKVKADKYFPDLSKYEFVKEKEKSELYFSEEEKCNFEFITYELDEPEEEPIYEN